MFSVLIATYNFNVIPLVTALQKQLLVADIEYEILCYDDASKSELNNNNKEINSFENCTFLELENNIGRSAIRNLLAKKAEYDWLLFLDGDVIPAEKSFIQQYLEVIKNRKVDVVCGGVAYERNPENYQYLHFKNGVKNEETTAKDRAKKPFKYFFTSNFLIHKRIFDEVSFEEKLTKYGREDMLFALDLEKKNYQIHHIENAIYHLGIEEDEVFINKTKQAMKNLVYLENENLIHINEAKLLKLVDKLKKLGLAKTVAKLNSYFEKQALAKKSLFYLNSLKISYLCKLSAE